MRTSKRNAERSEERQPEGGQAAARRETPGATVSPPLTAHALHTAQRAVGNAAVAAMIARRARPDAAPEQSDTGVREVLRSPGRPLAAPVRRDMEARFGADFSDVRLHTGAAAARSAHAIGARAYTSGSHVVIGDGGGDRHTLAHELTHVVQQRQGPVSGTDHGDGLRVSDPSDRFEREAEAHAHRIMSGPAPDTRRAPQDSSEGPAAAAGRAEPDTVQRASQYQFENAEVSFYKPGKKSANPLPALRDLRIERPSKVTGTVVPTVTKGRKNAPNPKVVFELEEAYQREARRQGVKRGLPNDKDVWKDLFGGAGYDRGHIMGLEVGGDDISDNIVPQWSLNQGTGAWRRIEQALVRTGSGSVEFQVSYDTDHGNYRKVMIPTQIDIYLNGTRFDEWGNKPDFNDLIRAGKDSSDLARHYTTVREERWKGRPTLTEKEMVDEFAAQVLALNRAEFQAYRDYENASAQGQAPGTSALSTYAQQWKLSDFPKERRERLIEDYLDAGFVTFANKTYTLHDAPTPPDDTSSESESASDSGDAMDLDSQPSPGQPFATIDFGSQSSSSDPEWEDRMSTDSD